MSKNGHAPTLKVAREIRQQERREEKEPRRGERHKATQTVSAARVAGTAIGEAATQSEAV
jgi:hypothetical protein